MDPSTPAAIVSNFASFAQPRQESAVSDKFAESAGSSPPADSFKDAHKALSRSVRVRAAGGMSTRRKLETRLQDAKDAPANAGAGQVSAAADHRGARSSRNGVTQDLGRSARKAEEEGDDGGGRRRPWRDMDNAAAEAWGEDPEDFEVRQVCSVQPAVQRLLPSVNIVCFTRKPGATGLLCLSRTGPPLRDRSVPHCGSESHRQ